jgi:Tol biopolymer transport system component
LTFDANTGHETSITADGSKIAFISNWEICIVNSDGTGLRQLTSDKAYKVTPAISGEGSRIAFVSKVD